MRAICGYRVQETTLRDAHFVCPRCGLDRDGAEIEPQRWWTFLGRRVIPLATHERLIECTTCGHRCDTGALEIPTTAMLAIYLDEATRAAAVTIVRATIGASGNLTPSVVAAAVTAIQDADRDYGEKQLAADLETLRSDQTAARLSRLTSELTAHGKQGFLRRITEIAVADGSMADCERRAIVGIGLALGMAAPHINGVLAVAELQTA